MFVTRYNGSDAIIFFYHFIGNDVPKEFLKDTVINDLYTFNKFKKVTYNKFNNLLNVLIVYSLNYLRYFGYR